MPFRRDIAPRLSADNDLTRAMVGIGMAFAADGDWAAAIEDTLLAASIEAMDRDDLRVLAVLTTWIGVHADFINADRLIRIVLTVKSERVRAFWSAMGRWQSNDRRFKRLAALEGRTRLDLLAVGTEFHVRRHGEDPRFEGSQLRVPRGTLRDRPGDVLTPVELAARHRGYYFRVLLGPSYRADMWAVLERDPALGASELARRTYGSFGTAWRVRRDFGILANVERPGHREGQARPI